MTKNWHYFANFEYNIFSWNLVAGMDFEVSDPEHYFQPMFLIFDHALCRRRPIQGINIRSYFLCLILRYYYIFRVIFLPLIQQKHTIYFLKIYFNFEDN